MPTITKHMFKKFLAALPDDDGDGWCTTYRNFAKGVLAWYFGWVRDGCPEKVTSKDLLRYVSEAHNATAD